MFEQLRNRLAAEASKFRREPLEIEELRPEDVTSLNLNWTSHFNTPTLREHLQEFPGMSLRVHGHSDYVIVDKWRRRDDVAQLVETNTRHYRGELINRLVQVLAEQDYAAIVIGADEETDNEKFYAEAGFVEMEHIIYYERPHLKPTYQPVESDIIIKPYTGTPIMLDDLLAVDNTAFPWLWWNSRTELAHYYQQEGVTIFLAYLTDPGSAGVARPVGYFGFTLYDRWAHLDRLAVVPDLQGQHLGAYQLAYALNLMAKRGASRVTLSTQNNNVKSQHLYEGFGFQRVKSLEYRLVGKWLKSAKSEAAMGKV